ncbi:GSK3B-interacting protein-like [Oratosquilla oratoria]|uniref:GSK3B-interacting protein-like n=1 Tax=Oratosquilla oratoria TaxID=337810 RepID=UPI003F76D8B5
MEDQEERVHDKEEWHKEATAVIQDVKDCVKHLVISSLPSSNSTIYFNLTTKEEDKYCVELTALGFRIVGKEYDDKSMPNEDYFETPYSLLDKLSPLYRLSFSNSLSEKLMLLISEDQSAEVSE